MLSQERLRQRKLSALKHNEHVQNIYRAVDYIEGVIRDEDMMGIIKDLVLDPCNFNSQRLFIEYVDNISTKNEQRVDMQAQKLLQNEVEIDSLKSQIFGYQAQLNTLTDQNKKLQKHIKGISLQLINYQRQEMQNQQQHSAPVQYDILQDTVQQEHNQQQMSDRDAVGVEIISQAKIMGIQTEDKSYIQIMNQIQHQTRDLLASNIQQKVLISQLQERLVSQKQDILQHDWSDVQYAELEDARGRLAQAATDAEAHRAREAQLTAALDAATGECDALRQQAAASRRAVEEAAAEVEHAAQALERTQGVRSDAGQRPLEEAARTHDGAGTPAERLRRAADGAAAATALLQAQLDDARGESEAARRSLAAASVQALQAAAAQPTGQSTPPQQPPPQTLGDAVDIVRDAIARQLEAINAQHAELEDARGRLAQAATDAEAHRAREAQLTAALDAATGECDALRQQATTINLTVSNLQQQLCTSLHQSGGKAQSLSDKLRKIKQTVIQILQCYQRYYTGVQQLQKRQEELFQQQNDSQSLQKQLFASVQQLHESEAILQLKSEQINKIQQQEQQYSLENNKGSCFNNQELHSISEADQFKKDKYELQSNEQAAILPMPNNHTVECGNQQRQEEVGQNRKGCTTQSQNRIDRHDNINACGHYQQYCTLLHDDYRDIYDLVCKVKASHDNGILRSVGQTLRHVVQRLLDAQATAQLIAEKLGVEKQRGDLADTLQCIVRALDERNSTYEDDSVSEGTCSTSERASSSDILQRLCQKTATESPEDALKKVCEYIKFQHRSQLLLQQIRAKAAMAESKQNLYALQYDKRLFTHPDVCVQFYSNLNRSLFNSIFPTVQQLASNRIEVMKLIKQRRLIDVNFKSKVLMLYEYVGNTIMSEQNLTGFNIPFDWVDSEEQRQFLVRNYFKCYYNYSFEKYFQVLFTNQVEQIISGCGFIARQPEDRELYVDLVLVILQMILANFYPSHDAVQRPDNKTIIFTQFAQRDYSDNKVGVLRALQCTNAELAAQ